MAKKEKKVILTIEKAVELLTGEVEKYNAAITETGAADDGGIKSAIVETNRAYIADAVSKITGDMTMSYVMGNRFTNVPSVTFDKDSGKAELVPADAVNASVITVPFDAVNTASSNPIPNLKSIRLLCRIFSENLYTACAKTADNGEKFAKESMGADILTMRRKVAKDVGSYWDATSMTAVQKQMAHLFKLYLGTKAPADCRAALKYLEWALIIAPKARNEKEMGTTKYEDRPKIIEWYVMEAMRVLLAGESFQCINKAGDVSKATEKAMKNLNSLPKEYTETAKGGRVRSGNAPARRKDKETQGKQEEPVKAEETKEETAA